MKRMVMVLGCLGLVLGLARAGDDAAPPAATRLPPAAAGAIDFQRDVQPILVRACVACHSNLKHKGGLRLDSGPAALKGGNSGTVIKPGDSAQSRLVHLVAGLD